MGDLQIDAATLARVRTKLESVESLLDTAATRMDGLASADVGPPLLVSRLGSFGEDWTDGLKGLETVTGSLADSLDVAESTLDEVDENLAGSGSGPS